MVKYNAQNELIYNRLKILFILIVILSFQLHVSDML